MRQVSLCGTAPGRPSPFTAYPLYASVACGPKTNGTLLQEYYILAGTRNNVAVIISFYRECLFNLPVHKTVLQLDRLAKFMKEQFM